MIDHVETNRLAVPVSRHIDADQIFARRQAIKPELTRGRSRWAGHSRTAVLRKLRQTVADVRQWLAGFAVDNPSARAVGHLSPVENYIDVRRFTALANFDHRRLRRISS